MKSLAEQSNDRWDGIVKSFFPDATPVQIYGSAIEFDGDSLEMVSVTCGGVTKPVFDARIIKAQ